jgi:hypothetical protein
MNPLARKFFVPNRENQLRQVIFLNEEPQITWEQASTLVYNLPRGWFELSRIGTEDRVEFIRDFWLDRIPYHPVVHPALFEFFEGLDDVIVVLTSKREGEPMEAELIYSLADGSSFFRGKPPCSEGEAQDVQRELDVTLPRDYVSFCRIHNGFGKLSEMGLLELDDLSSAKRSVINLLLKTEKRVKCGEMEVDPGALIPFYEALGLSSFQCFYSDWYPGTEMGNVYLSGVEYTLSDVRDKKSWVENLAFPTFSEWLVYYLQGMDLCT